MILSRYVLLMTSCTTSFDASTTESENSLFVNIDYFRACLFVSVENRALYTSNARSTPETSLGLISLAALKIKCKPTEQLAAALHYVTSLAEHRGLLLHINALILCP